MTRINFLTPEQEALIPEYQQKWKNIYLSTEPIQHNRAKAAVQGAYAVMGKPEPEVIFCSSPRAALERLQSYVETPQQDAIPSREEVQNNFFQFARAAWEMVKIIAKQKSSGTKPLHDLLGEVLAEPYQSLDKHIDNCLPKDLSTYDVVEQSFIGTSPLFDNLNKQMSRQGEPEFQRLFENRQPEDWQESLGMTAENIDKQLAWLPGKELLFRGWLKQMLKSSITIRISGVEHPKFREIILPLLSGYEQKFLLENPPFITLNCLISCIWLDYAFSVLNYPCKTQKWSALQGLAKYCGSIFGVNNLCIVCERPTKILVNEDNQLHGEGETAIEFADGFVAYAYNGRYLPEKYGRIHPSQWQTQWIFDEEYNDLQEALIQGIGAVRLSEELPLIEEEIEQEVMQEYTFFKLDKKGLRKTYILKRVDSQTGNIHAVFISRMEDTILRAIRYANRNYSAEDFPIPNNGEVE
ncbi:MAG: hypothetical protein KI793_28920 [Rivularia sp. (in: Bacteria)]|nr:hypothetical protein [Rivularia sp. MS3]